MNTPERKDNKSPIYYTDSITLIFDDNANTLHPRSFNLSCPFIPDDIEVSCAITPTLNNAGEYAIVPEVQDVGNIVFSAQMFAVQSNIPLGRNELCICSLNNSYNPISKYSNNSRASFNSSYTADVFNLSSGGRLTVGRMVLTFKFTRYL
jgi:hypothetical protein